MRNLLLIPAAAVVATAACGYGVAAVMGFDAHARELAAAIGTICVVVVAAILPVYFARHATQVVMTQAALLGTILHLFLSVAIVAIVILGHLRLHQAILYWLAAFYFTTLAALVAVFASAIKTAPVPTPLTTPKA